MTDYAAFSRLGVSTVHEAAGRTGVIDFQLTQVVPGSRVAGPARIALCAPGDNTMVHALIATANPGDVLVLTSPEPAPFAFIGELLATQARTRGAAAFLVDAAVRDLDELVAIGLPVWARFVRAQGATKAKLDDIAALGRTASILSADLAQAIDRPTRDEAGTRTPARCSIVRRVLGPTSAAQSSGASVSQPVSRGANPGRCRARSTRPRS